VRRPRIRTCALLLALSAASAAEGTKLRPIQALYSDDRGAGLRQPQGVACDGESLLVVADTGNRRLLRFTIVGDRVQPAGEIRLNEIPYPIKVQIGPKGELFALDGKSRRIARISPSGEFGGYVPLPGEGSAAPSIPRSFAIDREGNLFVIDIFQGRIIVLEPDGKSLRQIAFPREVGFLSDLTVDDKGTVFAIDSVARRVFLAKRTDALLAPLTGPMKEDMAFPTSIAVDGRGHLYIADQNEGGIVILGTDGSFRGRQAGIGWKEGMLREPTGLCAGIAGTLFVADRDNNRVQLFEVSE
jgi:NHL repeat